MGLITKSLGFRRSVRVEVRKWRIKYILDLNLIFKRIGLQLDAVLKSIKCAKNSEKRRNCEICVFCANTIGRNQSLIDSRYLGQWSIQRRLSLSLIFTY